MAREKKPAYGPVDPQQEEITFIVVKFKGGSESMQKGFDAVNNAIAALGPVQQNNQRVIVQRPPAQLPPASANGSVIDAETQDIPNENEVEELAPETAAPANGNLKPKKQAGPKQSFLTDFNLAPDNVKSWTDFAAEKNPDRKSV